jgi:PAS domain S-box-containing protein
MDDLRHTPGTLLSLLFWTLMLVGLFLTSHYSYLLFHSLTGFFSVVIATGVFAIAWNARRFQENNYLLFLGIAYLFVGALDLLYTLSYQGMGVFPGFSKHLPGQLWFAARTLESLSLFLAPQFIGRRLRPNVVLSVYLLAFSAIILIILVWRLSPLDLMPAGPALTALRKTGEYVNSAILLGALLLLWRQRDEFDPGVFGLLLGAIALALASDVALTFLARLSASAGLAGYLLKIASCYLIYRALIAAELLKPYQRLYHNLKFSGEILRHEKAFADRLMDMAQVMVLVLDAEGRILRLNHRCEAITGYTLADVKNRPFWEVFPAPEEVREVQEAFFDLIAGDFSQSWQTDRVARDGTRRLIAWSNTAFSKENGRVEYVIGTGIDISEQRELARRLQRLNGKLEQQIRDAPKPLGPLPAIDRAPEDFTAKAFHDLKVPLHWMRGYCQALEECSASRLDAKGLVYLQRLHGVARQLDQLLEAAREQAQMRPPQKPWQDTDLSLQAQLIAADLKRSAPARRVDFIIQTDLTAAGDPDLLQAVLKNLLSNAWKFTADVPQGRIEFGALPAENCHKSFFIRDNRTDGGRHQVNKLFRSLQRWHTHRDFSGSELSLAQVRSIILQHGGRIWAEAEVGQGLTFFFTLPHAPPGIEQDSVQGNQPNPLVD